MLKQVNRFALMLVLVLLAGSIITGDVGAERLEGSEVLSKVDKGMRSDSKIMHERMTLENASGQQRTRELVIQNKRTESDDFTLVRFMAPADVRGTGLLMVNDDMWLYLPALGRARRIAGHAKKGSFMGSDFSYQDMEQFGSTGFGTNFSATYLGTEEFGDYTTFKLELLPKTDDGDYKLLHMWVDKDKMIPRKIDYVDDSGSLLKTLTTDNLTDVDGRWVARRIEMRNIQNGTRTILEVTEVTFDADITDSVFTTRNLERGI